MWLHPSLRESRAGERQLSAPGPSGHPRALKPPLAPGLRVFDVSRVPSTCRSASGLDVEEGANLLQETLGCEGFVDEIAAGLDHPLDVEELLRVP
jgi:hypothetical protein